MQTSRSAQWMCGSGPFRLGLCVLLVVIALLPQANADWAGATSSTGAGLVSHSYLDTTNWTSGAINDTFTVPLAAASTVYFAGDRVTTGAVGVSESGLGLFGTESQVEGVSGLVINQNTNFVLTLSGGGATNNGASVIAAAHTLTLGGNVVLNSAVPGTGGAILGGVGTAGLSVNLGGQPRTFFLSNSSQGGTSLQKDMTVASGITNGALIKAGSGRLILQATNTLTGPVTVGWGQSVIGGNNTQCLVLQSAGALANVVSVNVLPSSVFQINNQTSTATTRLNSSGAVNLMNAYFQNDFGQKISSGQTYTETLSAVILASGLSELIQGEASSGLTSNNLSTISLNLGTVTRLNNSVMFLRNVNAATTVTGALDNPSIGTINNRVAMGNAASFLVGGSGGAGSTQLRIIPFMLMQSAILASSAYPDSFVTYDSGLGSLRPLNTNTEFRTGLNMAGNADDNVISVGGETLSANTTNNSLLVAGSAATVALNSKTLTVTSGLIALTAGHTVSGGTLSFGSTEGVVLQMSASGYTLSANLIGNGGLTIMASPSGSAAVLSGTNSGLTGTISIVGKASQTANSPYTIKINHKAALGSGSNPLVLHPNARAIIGASGAITAAVASVSGGSFNSQGAVQLNDALDSFTIGNGTVAGAGIIRMDGTNAFLSPGFSGTNTPDLARIGRLDLSGGAVQLVNGAVKIDLYAAPKAAGSLVDPINDMLYAGTSLAFQKGGNLALQVNTLGAFTPANGTSWTIAVAGTNGAVNTVTSTGTLFDTITSGYSVSIGNYGGGTSNAVILTYSNAAPIHRGTKLSIQ